MKKILFMLIIAFQCFKNVKIFAQARWSNPNRHECYKGITFSTVNHGKGGTGYLWGIRIKNNYSRPVQLEYRLIVGGEQYAGGGFQVTRWLNSGEEWKEGEGLFTALLFKNNSSSYVVEIQEVCFNKEKGCFNNCYAKCDNGSPNQPNCNGNSNITSNNNQTGSNKSYNSNEQSNAEIDNLNTYLLKIPDGDSQKQQILSNFENLKNANLSDSQRASQIRNLTSQAKSRAHELEGESSQKTGQYLDYYTRATNAGKAGNCDEAISNWKSAIAVAVNDVQRNNAQQWLDEVYKAKANGHCKNVNSTSSPSLSSPTNSSNQQVVTPSASDIKAQNIANTAASVAQLGVAVSGIVQASRQLKNIERQLFNKLNGNENLYPEATVYYNNFLKYKKRSRKCTWIGVGIATAGIGMMLAGINSYAYDDNSALYNTGIGTAILGGVIYFAGIPATIKSSVNFGKAQNLVGFNSNVEIKPFFAMNRTGGHVGLSIGF
jgi:hypothetical protein